MRAFFLDHAPVLVWAVAALELLLLFGLFLRFSKTKDPFALLGFLIDIGLLYDTMIIALGHVLPEPLLGQLSQYRFILHGLLIPLLLPIAARTAELPGGARIFIWILTIALMAAGFWEGSVTKLSPVEFAGLQRYVASEGTPKLAEVLSRVLSFGTVIPLLIGGLVGIFRKRGAWIFLGGLFMFGFSALGPATGNTDLIFLFSMFGEVLMVLSFLLGAKMND